ncbi:MAG: tRNA (N(6)-L-threonylcarbamoyladenosine(37)-C(2))-methylthiotransferase MtaB [Candidatus Omnitrophica bacterium]|nr:tRNA (N(6)-L-threonylcarbamoyladenosine(37)-C(2))-methylthiotransferase MtaB [Candidatus Omnitrophota bacterium]
MKTCAFKTLGCKVNQYETQAIRESLARAGFAEVGESKAPDFYIINTCTVTGRGDSDSRRAIQKAHRMSPRSSIIVTGCCANDNDWIGGIEGVKLIIKNESKNRISELLRGGSTNKPGDIFDLRISDFEGRSKAFIKIQDGCSYRCSYCKIPSVRGPSKSRPLTEAVDEAKRLLDNGFKELVLTGISLGSYKGGIIKLLQKLATLRPAALDDEFRIRISSIEPADVKRGLVDFMAEHKDKICNHLHVPLQSGDDDVLKAMRRPYAVSRYLKIIDLIRRKIPDVAITTDVIVGFPTETEEAFKNTLKTLKEIAPARGHVFAYSPREGTPAHALKDIVPNRIKSGRSKAVRDILSATSLDYRKRFIGKRLRVLIETKRDKASGLLTGYSNNYIRVNIKNGDNSIINSLANIRITDANSNETIGELNI